MPQPHRCYCQCHRDRRLPPETFGGVDVLDGVEAVTSCLTCKATHWPALCQMDDYRWTEYEGEEGG